MPISETEEENYTETMMRVQSDSSRPVPPVLQVRESCAFGIIPRQLILQIENQHDSQQDWKLKEQASEDLLFFVETLPIPEVKRLTLYADSFIQFIEKSLLSEVALKVVRIGLRLLSKSSFSLMTF